MDPLRDDTPSDRSRVRRVASVVGGEQCDLAAIPEAAVRVQLLYSKTDAAQLVEAVRSLVPRLWPLDGDQERQTRARAGGAGSNDDERQTDCGHQQPAHAHQTDHSASYPCPPRTFHRRTRKANAYVTGLGRTRRVVVSDTLLAGGLAGGDQNRSRPRAWPPPHCDVAFGRTFAHLS